MDVWGAHVPLSWWTVAALLVGAAPAVALWRPLARWRGWRGHWTLVAWLSLAAVLALTLTPGDDLHHTGLRECIPRGYPDLRQSVFHTGGGIVADGLNVLLTVPVTLSIVMATRRLLPGLLISPLLPLLVELTQTVIPGRVCAVSDLVTNTIGGLLGLGLGWALHTCLEHAGEGRLNGPRL